MLVLKEYHNLLEAMSSLFTTEEITKLDPLNQVTDDLNVVYNNTLKTLYTEVAVTMFQDKLYQVFAIPLEKTLYSNLYKDDIYIENAFNKIMCMQHCLRFVNLHDMLSSPQYQDEKRRLETLYPANGGREGLLELISVYNLRHKFAK